MSAESAACQMLPPAQQRELDRRDAKRQVELVSDTAERADLITVARVVSVSEDGTTATFAVERLIKGRAPTTVTLDLEQVVHVGCYSSAFFFSVNLERGVVYLIYAENGKVLRAGGKRRYVGDISLRKELRLIRAKLGPNNSSKPTPLRGAA